MTAYLTQRFAAKATRESEERQAKLRAEDDVRRATREHRGERARALVEFLDIARKYLAQGQITALVDRAYEAFDSAETENYSIDRWREDVRSATPDAFKDAPALLLVFGAGAKAVASAPTEDIMQAVMEVMMALHQQRKTPNFVEAAKLVAATEAKVERYLVGADEAAGSSTSG